jgi:hypothetical protein
MGRVHTAGKKAELIFIPVGSDSKAEVVAIAFAVSKDPGLHFPPRMAKEVVSMVHAEIGTGWFDPSKQEIHLECPPGEPRPGDLIAELIRDTGLPLRDASSRLFGNWEWDYSDIARTVWEKAVPLIERRMTDLYGRSIIRAGQCGGFTTEKSLGL